MNTVNIILRNRIQILEQGNLILKILSTKNGFHGFYTSCLRDFKTDKERFDYCNQYFKEISGVYKYESFEEFKGIQIPKTNHNNLESLERDYLISWFKSKGFNSFTAFKAIVLHYYPEIYEETLFVFWNYKIDTEVAKYVNYVKQIIGE
jgi:hypothetical protein